jgi:hypothetical protein
MFDQRVAELVLAIAPQNRRHPAAMSVGEYLDLG